MLGTLEKIQFYSNYIAGKVCLVVNQYEYFSRKSHANMNNKIELLQLKGNTSNKP